MTTIDGIYSIVTAAVGGCSSAIVALSNGRIQGNDIAGGRYGGSYSVRNDGMVEFNVEMTFPPGIYGIYGSSLSETFQTHTIPQIVSIEFFRGNAIHEVPSYGVTMLARQIPDDYAPMAGPDGIDHLIAALMSAKASWERHLADE